MDFKCALFFLRDKSSYLTFYDENYWNENYSFLSQCAQQQNVYTHSVVKCGSDTS